jgi:outer membrane protein OmpA-like peptidoglycan-associated protein
MRYLIVVVALMGCATPAPRELVEARSAYARAASGPAARVTPNQLQEAADALALAEQGRSAAEKRDRAYVALRTAEKAEAAAQGILAAERRNDVDREIVSLQEKRAAVEAVPEKEIDVDGGSAPAAPSAAAPSAAAPSAAAPSPAAPSPAAPSPAAPSLPAASAGGEESTSTSDSSEAAAGSPRGTEDQQVRIPVPRAAVASFREVRDAYERLAHVASVVDMGKKGWVVSVVGPAFVPGDVKLLPDTLPRLDAVATALRATTAKEVAVIEVQTANESPQTGSQLSQRRAVEVKQYLVSRGVEPARVVPRAVVSESSPAATGVLSGLAADHLDIRLPPPEGR